MNTFSILFSACFLIQLNLKQSLCLGNRELQNLKTCWLFRCIVGLEETTFFFLLVFLSLFCFLLFNGWHHSIILCMLLQVVSVIYVLAFWECFRHLLMVHQKTYYIIFPITLYHQMTNICIRYPGKTRLSMSVTVLYI